MLFHLAVWYLIFLLFSNCRSLPLCNLLQDYALIGRVKILILLFSFCFKLVEETSPIKLLALSHHPIIQIIMNLDWSVHGQSRYQLDPRSNLLSMRSTLKALEEVILGVVKIKFPSQNPIPNWTQNVFAMKIHHKILMKARVMSLLSSLFQLKMKQKEVEVLMVHLQLFLHQQQQSLRLHLTPQYHRKTQQLLLQLKVISYSVKFDCTHHLYKAICQS